MSQISEEMFLEWKSHPVTQALEQVLRQWVEEGKQNWAEGNYLSPETKPLEDHNVGMIRAYTVVLNVDFEKLEMELIDE